MISIIIPTLNEEGVIGDTLQKLKTFQDYTTVQVSREAGGKILVQQPEKQAVNIGKRLVQFRVHTSVHRGIEPRLTFGDNLVLKYDLVQNKPFLLYEFTF